MKKCLKCNSYDVDIIYNKKNTITYRCNYCNKIWTVGLNHPTNHLNLREIICFISHILWIMIFILMIVCFYIFSRFHGYNDGYHEGYRDCYMNLFYNRK